MIVTDKELDALRRAIERARGPRTSEYDPEPGTRFLHRHPHLLLLLGYDEFRLLRYNKPNLSVVEEFVGQDAAFPTPVESVYRQTTSGEWHLFQGVMMSGEYLNFFRHGATEVQRISIDQLLEIVSHAALVPPHDSHALVCPSIWMPQRQSTTRFVLADATRSILRTLYQEAESLASIHWRKLEEIVAELLIDRGMQIHLTKPSHDGGRDIIARGELIPGEPLTLAIEVKQRPVVGIAEVQRALFANRNFPALLVATSGRFSAGVVGEKNSEHASLRLFLKDGLALKQWIDLYAARRGWKRDA
jgi:hypothetical protein